MIDGDILMVTFRVWFFEIALSALDYFVLMRRVYEPRVGVLRAHRPVHEILEGWHVEKGYMWPYVLLAYFGSPLVVGVLLGRAW